MIPLHQIERITRYDRAGVSSPEYTNPDLSEISKSLIRRDKCKIHHIYANNVNDSEIANQLTKIKCYHSLSILARSPSLNNEEKQNRHFSIGSD